jgi:hypothetical protein
VAQVVFWAKLVLVVVKVHMCLCASSITADPLLCHFGKQRSSPFDFHQLLLNVFLLPLSSFDAQETQLLTSSLLGL